MPDNMTPDQRDELRRLGAIQQRMNATEHALRAALADRGLDLESFQEERYEQYQRNRAELAQRTSCLLAESGASYNQYRGAYAAAVSSVPRAERQRADRMSLHELTTDYRLHSEPSWIPMLDGDPSTGRYWEPELPEEQQRLIEEINDWTDNWAALAPDADDRFMVLVTDHSSAEQQARSFAHAQHSYAWAQNKLCWIAPDDQAHVSAVVWDRAVDAVDGRPPDSALDVLAGPLDQLNTQFDQRYEFFRQRDMDLARATRYGDPIPVAGLDQLTEASRPSLTARFEGCGHDTVIADLTGELDRVTEERDGLLLERDRWATPPAIPEFGR